MKNHILAQSQVKTLKDAPISPQIDQNNQVLQKKQTERKVDPQTRRLLTYLFTGTRGGPTRLKILLLLAQKPLNTHQIAESLGFDYKAIDYQLEVLEKNNLVSKTGPRYGTIFFLSAFLEYNISAFNEIVESSKRKGTLQ